MLVHLKGPDNPFIIFQPMQLTVSVFCKWVLPPHKITQQEIVPEFHYTHTRLLLKIKHNTTLQLLMTTLMLYLLINERLSGQSLFAKAVVALRLGASASCGAAACFCVCWKAPLPKVNRWSRVLRWILSYYFSINNKIIASEAGTQLEAL